MRVLLLSFHYPPDPAVGSVRAGRVAAAFAGAGHEVEVVAARLPGGAADRHGGAVRVHRVRRLRNPREIALAVRALVRRRPAAAPAGASATGWIVPAHVPSWKRFLVAMALMPDADQGFILPAIARSLRLMRRRVDLLYTSGPPHSAHVAGLVLERLTGVRWAAEFRDPWTDNAVQPRYAVSETAFALRQWLERRTLAAADHVIAVSDSAAARFAEKTAGSGRGRVLTVRNGIPDLAPSPEKAPHENRRIIYLGSLYHGRDPRAFLAALATLRAEGDAIASRTCVEFYGDCRIFRGQSVQGFIDEHGLGGAVVLNDAIPRARVADVMAGADLLLLLAQHQPLQVPAKLYEYLGARRRILAFADAHGETAAMLERVGGHFVVTGDDPAGARETVREALHAPPGPPAMDEAVLEEWSAGRQMAKLVDHLVLPLQASRGIAMMISVQPPGV